MHQARALIAAVALTATGLAVSAPGTASASPVRSTAVSAVTASLPVPTSSGIDWGTCASVGLQEEHAECGYLSVPLDYAHPAGTKIQLAVSRVLHKTDAAHYQGVMLTNPGGPGGSGLGLSTLGKDVPNGGGDPYDWIGFDPRGVGSSVPSLTCQPDYFSGDRPDYAAVTPELESVWLARSKSYADACAANGGALLDHISTPDSARDMESIRKALGTAQINYYGFSYGTYLGQVYATLFPSRLRRAVLDSNVDPRRVWYEANLDQDIAFDRNIDIWFDWLARHDAAYHLGATQAAVRDLFYKTQHQLDLHAAGGVIGSDEWNDLFLPAGYYQLTWTELAEAFSGYINDGDVDSLVAEYEAEDGPGDDNGFAVYNAVQCSDTRWPQDYATWKADAIATDAVAPFETWGNTWFNAPCLFWQGKTHNRVYVNGDSAASVLLIGETLDAATPFSGSLEVRRRFHGASLIALPGGTSHAVTLFGNACVDDQIADYLLTGAKPARKPGNVPDATCVPLPEPEPEEPALSETATGSARAAGAGRVALLAALLR